MNTPWFDLTLPPLPAWPTWSTLQSDTYWLASFWVGSFTLTTTLLLLVVLFILKLSHQARRHRDESFDVLWQPLLMRSALMTPDDATPAAPWPHLKRGDDWRLIKLWVRLQATLRGQANDRLRQLGLQLGCDRLARPLLDSPHRSEQIFGILCLGYLRDSSAWDLLAPRVDDARNSVFIYVAWALLQIAPAQAIPLVMAQLVQRRDLNILQASTVLKPFRRLINEQLALRIASSTETEPHPDTAPLIAWLLKLGYGLGLTVDTAALQRLLRPDQPMDVIIGALRLLHRPEGLPWVRDLTDHPDWQVRTQVATTLGRIGDATDVDRLMQLLMDAQWWVRYRAAQALAITPFVDRDTLSQRIAALPDRYAREMAMQVFLEVPEVPSRS